MILLFALIHFPHVVLKFVSTIYRVLIKVNKNEERNEN